MVDWLCILVQLPSACSTVGSHIVCLLHALQCVRATPHAGKACAQSHWSPTCNGRVKVNSGIKIRSCSRLRTCIVWGQDMAKKGIKVGTHWPGWPPLLTPPGVCAVGTRALVHALFFIHPVFGHASAPHPTSSPPQYCHCRT